ncbi:hypothetical protein [Edaphobacter aggregans]|uniref:hypothetical protein n=1 Tax=Edaphobacter aggregans TaxID=570835 RepID=UPI00055784E7|nr:hypothetical protein [Edaphobacter aggregans]
MTFREVHIKLIYELPLPKPEPKELALCGQSARRTNCGDPRQPDQFLPQAPDRSQLYLTQLLINLPSTTIS